MYLHSTELVTIISSYALFMHGRKLSIYTTLLPSKTQVHTVRQLFFEFAVIQSYCR